MSEQYQKGSIIRKYLKSLRVHPITIAEALSDKNLEKSYQLITNNPSITKDEFFNAMGLIEEKE